MQCHLMRWGIRPGSGQASLQMTEARSARVQGVWVKRAGARLNGTVRRLRYAWPLATGSGLQSLMRKGSAGRFARRGLPATQSRYVCATLPGEWTPGLTTATQAILQIGYSTETQSRALGAACWIERIGLCVRTVPSRLHRWRQQPRQACRAWGWLPRQALPSRSEQEQRLA